MKKILAFAAASLLSVSLFAQDGASIYQKYSDADGVDAVFISPAMLRLIGVLPAVEMNDSELNLGNLLRSFNGFYVLDSKNPSVNSSLKSDAEKLISKGNYEMLMEVKENGEAVRIYTAGDEETVTSLVVLSINGDKGTFVSIDGSMSRAELENALAGK